MDRGVRRRKDETFVAWIAAEFKRRGWGWPKDGRRLGAKKIMRTGCRCSRKTKGRPKISKGICYAAQNKSKTGRNRWRLTLYEWE